MEMLLNDRKEREIRTEKNEKASRVESGARKSK